MKTGKTFVQNSSHIPIVHYEVGAVWEKESTLRFNLSGWRILGGGNQANRQVVNHSKKPPMKNIMLFFKSSLNILWFSFWQFLVFSFILYCIKSTHGKIVLHLFCTVVQNIEISQNSENWLFNGSCCIQPQISIYYDWYGQMTTATRHSVTLVYRQKYFVICLSHSLQILPHSQSCYSSTSSKFPRHPIDVLYSLLPTAFHCLLWNWHADWIQRSVSLPQFYQQPYLLRCK